MINCRCLRWLFGRRLYYYELDDGAEFSNESRLRIGRKTTALDLSVPKIQPPGDDDDLDGFTDYTYREDYQYEFFRNGMQMEPPKLVAERVVKALDTNDDSAWLLGKGKVSTTSVKLIFDNFSLADLRSICCAIRQRESVITVEFGCNNFGDAGVEVITECLKESKIQQLMIWGNSVGDRGVGLISEFLGSCECLSALVLSNNDITDTGLALLSSKLHTRPTLTSIDLSVNSSISDAGIAAFVSSVKDDKIVQIAKLNINNASIGDVACQHLAAWISRPSCSLLKLDLSYNMIEDTGAESLALALELNTQLYELNLSGNLFSNRGVQRILRALQRDQVSNRSVPMEDISSLQR